MEMIWDLKHFMTNIKYKGNNRGNEEENKL